MVSFIFGQILDKKIHKNPKYEHIGATVDTGTCKIEYQRFFLDNGNPIFVI